MSDTIEPTEAEASVLAELFSTTRRQSNLAILRAYRDAEVAERDRRIAELETHLKLTVNQLKHTQRMAKNGYGPAMLTPDIILFSEQILAKSGRSAP